MKHTPGPWMVHKESSDSFYVAQESGPDYVARNVDEGNAHIIAAAWEMLEALKMTREFFDALLEAKSADEIHDIIDSLLSDRLLDDRVDAAIAKAEAK